MLGTRTSILTAGSLSLCPTTPTENEAPLSFPGFGEFPGKWDKFRESSSSLSSLWKFDRRRRRLRGQSRRITNALSHCARSSSCNCMALFKLGRG